MAFQANAFQNDAFHVEVAPAEPRRRRRRRHRRRYGGSKYVYEVAHGGGDGGGRARSDSSSLVVSPASSHLLDEIIVDAAFQAGRLLQDKMRAAALVGAKLSEQDPETYAAAALGALIEDDE